MDKAAIKNFSIWARNKLIADISYKTGLLGITEKEIKAPLPQSTENVQFFDIGSKEPYSISGSEIEQRRRLAEEIDSKARQSSYATAYKSVIEEVAYTWFNRLIAIRFMEVNDYLPTRIRVLSSESQGKLEPDLVTHPLEADLGYTPYEKDRIMQLKHENKLNELFRMLFIKQCNALNKNLPELFEKTNDYTELLFNVSFTDKDGVVYHLVNDIAEDDFDVSKEGQVEIIGWLYQYYNTERKNEVINIYKGTIKKEDIPAATQLFTTNWVVRYMVDNSLGRYWIERNPDSKLSEKLQYFVRSKTESIEYIDEKISPEDISIFDPCMGSGHILVYAFDVLIEIYKESGYAERDAAQLIVKNNIYGLDIDKRAYQLAYFAVMMKAQSYDRRFLNRDIEPNLAPIIETNEIPKLTVEGITIDKSQNAIGEYLIKAFRDAKEIGSLLSVESHDYKEFSKQLDNYNLTGQIAIESDSWLRRVKPVMESIAKQASIMTNKYSVVVTNPPYMNKLEGQLKKFVVEQYKPYSGDLFSVFMYRNFDYCKPNGYSAFMTPFVWMFIKTYENLRKFIINNKSITTLVQMEYSAFEEATVPICTFVFSNQKMNRRGLYFRLSDFKGGMNVQNEKVLEAIDNPECGYYYETKQENFNKIPGSPVAYWMSERIYKIYKNKQNLSSFGECKSGIMTGDDSIFLKLWHEVNSSKIGFDCKTDLDWRNSTKKWFSMHKGGAFRKWYGNLEHMVNIENEGYDIKNSGKNYRLRDSSYYFKKGITWSNLTSGDFSSRYADTGTLFGSKGPIYFNYNFNEILYTLGLLNSCVINNTLSYLSETLDYTNGQIESQPFIYNIEYKQLIDNNVKDSINISMFDWDSFETSWDFIKSPLLVDNREWIVDSSEGKVVSNEKSLITNYYTLITKIKDSYEDYKNFTNNQFEKLKANEEELNRIFIEIYGLQKELTPEISDKDITIAKIFDSQDEIYDDIRGNRYILTKEDVIKQFISYAVGCMFGRYSIDIEGLAYAGGEWDADKYKTFIPDEENIILINDEEYFSDDIVGLFVDFVKKVYGEETLEENLDFIAQALNVRGDSPREIIRNYIIKDFFKDHCKTYKKRPIYWLFDSGRQNGFKALIYMHRYDENTIGNLRIDYLHKMQRIYENEISRMQDTIDNSNNAREITAATKRKEKLIKQLQETKEYDEKIAHLALARTSIDLDDGVNVNYEKVQTDRDGNKYNVMAKI